MTFSAARCSGLANPSYRLSAVEGTDGVIHSTHFMRRFSFDYAIRFRSDRFSPLSLASLPSALCSLIPALRAVSLSVLSDRRCMRARGAIRVIRATRRDSECRECGGFIDGCGEAVTVPVRNAVAYTARTRRVKAASKLGASRSVAQAHLQISLTMSHRGELRKVMREEVCVCVCVVCVCVVCVRENRGQRIICHL